MTPLFRTLAVVALATAPMAASAQGYRGQGYVSDPQGVLAGRAPWSQPWEYDTGGDNDNFPARPAYQQGGGQQTGGPARNLIPRDGFTIAPR